MLQRVKSGAGGRQRPEASKMPHDDTEMTEEGRMSVLGAQAESDDFVTTPTSKNSGAGVTAWWGIQAPSRRLRD